DALQVGDAVEVDEVVEAGEAQRQHRDQALAAGERLGVAAVLLQQADGIGRRLGRVVFERRRFHWCAPSLPWIRSRMCDGVSGWMLTALIPNGDRASATALMIAGGAPMAPPSPMPLNPPGRLDGVSMWPYSMTGTSVDDGGR